MNDPHKQIRDLVDRRMDAAAIELTNALKETLSVPVPQLVNKKVRIPGQGRQAQTFIKVGRTFQRVQKGYLRTLDGKTYMVPAGYTIYTKASGKRVFVQKATPGAPPRKFEGRLRAGHTWERPRATAGELVRRVGTNVEYAPKHEKGIHPYFMKTLLRVKPKLERILGQAL